MHARFFSIVAAALVIAAAAALPAHAQGWKPDRNVELIIPAGAGGSLDNTGRTINRTWDAMNLVPVPTQIVNRSGGGHAIAYAYLNQHQNEPNIISITSATILINHINGRLKVTYTDFTPLAVMVTEYIAFVVKPESPIKTGKDLLDTLKKDPQSLSIGISSARGGTHHLSVALPAKSAGVDFKNLKLVAFNSSSDAVTALLGGHVDVISTSNVIAGPHIAEGRLRAIAISSPKRIPGALANVPTWGELGQKGVWENWRGLIGSKGMTPDQAAFWGNVLEGVSKNGEFVKFADKNNWVIDFKGPAATRAFMKESYDEIKDLMSALGFAK